MEGIELRDYPDGVASSRAGRWMISIYPPPQVSIPTALWCDWDPKGRVGTATVDGVLGPGEGARKLNVAASGLQHTWRSSERVNENVAAHDVSSFTE